jgi:hypothetical protein
MLVPWRESFLQIVQESQTAAPLKAASISADLTAWTAIAGETVLVVGNRGEGETFPWGYFKFWMLHTNLGRFEKV